MKWRPGRLALCELLVLVLLLTVAHLAAGGEAEGPVPARVLSDCGGLCRNTDGRRSTLGPRSLHVPPAARCPAAQKAIGYYRRAFTASRTAMGLAGAPARAWYPCDAAKRRALEWRDKASAARRALATWTTYQFEWQTWLPAKWYRVARCETGVNWSHDSGTYVSAFGIYRAGYADDAHRIGNLSWDETIRARGTVPTPREQYDAALSHYRAHGGFSGWGCRGA